MKIMDKICGLVMILSCVAVLQGSIGCQKIDHTPNYWNVSKPRYVECSCPCSQVLSDNKGQCTQCGHYGNPERGAITKRVTVDLGFANN